jgi:hypothetical protein
VRAFRLGEILQGLKQLLGGNTFSLPFFMVRPNPCIMSNTCRSTRLWT